MDRPILFSGPMVRAILDGRKTQTRRVLNPQPHADCEGFQLVGTDCDTGKPMFEALESDGKPFYAFPTGDGCLVPYPRIAYGKGDHLYVREAWRAHILEDQCKPSEIAALGRRYWHEEGRDNCDAHGRLRPGIHMPKAFARIWLRVTDVRVQRVRGISTPDILAEGVVADRSRFKAPTFADDPAGRRQYHKIHSDAFQELWDSLNKERGYGWELNPWVAAYTFERLEPK